MVFNKIRNFIQFVLCCDIPLKDYGKYNISHPIGIVIAKYSKVAKGTKFAPNIVIGAKDVKRKEYPTIKENVFIGANSTIIGGVTIGKNVTIGSGSVVVKDVPDNTIFIQKKEVVYNITNYYKEIK